MPYLTKKKIYIYIYNLDSPWSQHFCIEVTFQQNNLVSVSEFCHQITFDRNELFARPDTLPYQIYILTKRFIKISLLMPQNSGDALEHSTPAEIKLRSGLLNTNFNCFKQLNFKN